MLKCEMWKNSICELWKNSSYFINKLIFICDFVYITSEIWRKKPLEISRKSTELKWTKGLSQNVEK